MSQKWIAILAFRMLFCNNLVVIFLKKVIHGFTSMIYERGHIKSNCLGRFMGEILNVVSNQGSIPIAIGISRSNQLS